jgi:hypothetical protein
MANDPTPGVPADVPEADYLEQLEPAVPDDGDTNTPRPHGDPLTPAVRAGQVEANEADLLEQQQELPPEDEYPETASSGPEADY